MTYGRLATVSGALLLLLALPATGWIEVGLWPSAPCDWLAASWGLTAFLALVSLTAADARPGAGRLLRVLLAALPFLALATTYARGAVGTPLPGPGFALVFAVVLALPAASPQVRVGSVAALLVLLGLDLALAHARGPLLPAAWNPLRQPLTWVDAALADEVERGAGLEGARPGAFVRLPAAQRALVEGPGPWWGVAERGGLPRAGPVVRVLDGGPAAATERVPLSTGGTATVVRDGPEPAESFDLSAYDVLVVPQGAAPWKDLEPGRAGRWARAISVWVRRGGLLIGPAAGEPWPSALGQVLGSAAVGQGAGAAQALPLGLGHVVRAEDRAQALVLVGDARLWPALGTALDGLADPPPPPPEFAPWNDDPPARRGAGGVLAAFLLALALLEPLARSSRSALRVLALPTAAAALGGAFLAPPGPAAVAHALVLDLGAPGGRRVEALWLSAGDRGYLGRVAFTGEGAVRAAGTPAFVLGPDGPRLLLSPGASLWLLRHGPARGVGETDREDRSAGFLRALLRGPVDDARLRYGRSGPVGCRLEGLTAPSAATLTLR